MKAILSAIALLLSAPMALAWGPLAAPEEMAGATLVLDIRSSEDFVAGHIPGAVNTPYGLYRGTAESPGRVPELSNLQETLRGVGATYGGNVLVVHAGTNATDFGAAARVYWTLKSAGFTSLAVLNGGYAAWADTGAASQTGEAEVTASNIVLTWSDDWMMDTAGVQAVVAGTSQAVLLDARPLDFFKGETKHGAATAAGTLEGAFNIVHSTWFGSGGPVIDAPQEMLERIRKVAGENSDAPLVSFCNTGHWAATNWFAASELAGVEGVKLYPESMVGWTLLGNPVINGDG